MSALRTNACWKFYTLVINPVDNILIAPDLKLLLFSKFIDAVNVCMVNTFLNGGPYLIVN